jgi:hypothetical protein
MRLYAHSRLGARRPPPRHRAPTPRSLAAAWAGLLALVVALVLSGPAAPASPAYAESDQPTVSFIGSGPAPLACSSRPDVPNMTIKKNTRIVLANFTGADATATLEDSRTIDVADGAAISVKLREGDHTITMAPKCLDTYEVSPTVITVVKALPAAAPPVSAPAVGPAGTTASGSTGTPYLTSPDLSGAPPARVGGSGVTEDAAGAGTTPDDGAAAGPEVREARAARPESAPDVRGARLLGLIAAICVFGVTSAIIRAIVAERATGALSV